MSSNSLISEFSDFDNDDKEPEEDQDAKFMTAQKSRVKKQALEITDEKERTPSRKVQLFVTPADSPKSREYNHIAVRQFEATSSRMNSCSDAHSCNEKDTSDYGNQKSEANKKPQIIRVKYTDFKSP